MKVHVFSNCPADKSCGHLWAEEDRHGSREEKEFGAEARQFVVRSFYVDEFR